MRHTMVITIYYGDMRLMAMHAIRLPLNASYAYVSHLLVGHIAHVPSSL